MTDKKPFSYSPITLIEGPPRAGKTNTAVARVVDAYKKDPSIRIFANFHLYGIKYVFADLATIVEYLNSPLFRAAYIIIDAAYIGMEARKGMELLTQVMTYLGMQAGKRRLRLIIIVQHGRMIDWRARWLVTEHIFCTYDEATQMITLKIKDKRKKRDRSVTYWAPQYWRYYDTEEVVLIPESKLAKALMGAR